MQRADLQLTVIIPTYEDAQRAIEAARAALAQSSLTGIGVDVLVIDDGSRPDVVHELGELNDLAHARLIRLEVNEGRAAARNRGAREATGQYLFFMDCDCLPHTSDVLQRHIDMLDAGCVATCGDVIGPDRSFWSRYQERASFRRRRAFASGQSYRGTSQNLAVRRDAFLEVGGFDAAYRQYGFEDRDLLIRLATRGTVGWSQDATVVHRDVLTLPDVLRKLHEAGRSGSTRFRQDHPDAYVALGYGRIDVRDNPFFAWPASIGGHVATVLAPLLDALASRRWLPFAVASMCVRLFSAAAYALGTSEIVPHD